MAWIWRGTAEGPEVGFPVACLWRVPVPIFSDVLPARKGSDSFPSSETTRVHHAARRRGGGVAARGRGSSPSACGASACSWAIPRTTWKRSRSSPRSGGTEKLGGLRAEYRFDPLDDARRRGGETAVREGACGTTTRSHSFVVTVTTAALLEKRAPFQSFSRRFPIRSAAASSRARRGRAARYRLGYGCLAGWKVVQATQGDCAARYQSHDAVLLELLHMPGLVNPIKAAALSSQWRR